MHQSMVATLIAFLSTLLLTPLASDAASRPNVLLLVSDDQRPDTVGALGNNIIQTPNLDWLVKHGMAFTRATCGNPICTPSRAEILTGASGFEMGVRDFGGKISPKAALFAETLRSAGYDSCYVGKWHNDGRPSTRGYTHQIGLYAGGGGRWAVPSFDWNGRLVTGYRGWTFQTDDRKFNRSRPIGLTADISAEFADAAIEFITKSRDEPFFLHVNFTAPHDPLLMPHGYESKYDPSKIPVPANFLSKHPIDHGNYEGRDERLFEWPRTKEMVQRELAVYYAVISHMDAQIGRVISQLRESKQLENTIVVFASDHGLAIGSHGLRGKQNMYEHTIGVPLIFSGPSIPSGQKSVAQCYLRDIFPTVCDLTNIPIPKAVTAKSLQPVLAGKVNQVRTEVFGYFRNYQRMIRTERWKLIEYPQVKRTQLFDLENDPLELKDLSESPARTEIRKQMLGRLRKWQMQVGDQP